MSSPQQETGGDHDESDEEVAYGESEYWDERYKKPAYQDYEWYLSYEKIKESHAFKDVYIKGNDTRVLHVGAGNSKIFLNLLNEGYRNQVNIDISKVVVDEMRQKYSSHLSPTFSFIEMDARKMSFADETFDFVFEKGTLDAVACSSDSYQNLFLIVKECCRVLRIGGYFVSVTFATEDMRLKHLSRADFPWKVEVIHIDMDGELPDGSKQQYFVYKMQKTAKLIDREKPSEDLLAAELRAASDDYRNAEIELAELRISSEKHLEESKSSKPNSVTSSAAPNAKT